MANDVMFEGKERRMPKIEKCLAEYGLGSLEEARELCKSKGFDPYEIVKGVQPIALKTPAGPTLWAALSRSRKAPKQLPTPPRPSVSVWKRSASPAP